MSATSTCIFTFFAGLTAALFDEPFEKRTGVSLLLIVPWIPFAATIVSQLVQ
jgi:hypothetical protein